ncbi:hypothetical protein K6V78_08490 [Streptococcus gallolyticus]|nr:hypothetical protein [Streptococcus gallolyticus]MBY5041561.1 hypothetical protein [Streptococcus gallolyticus]
MLTRQALHEDLFEILWPGYRKFVTEASFSHRQGDKLYFCNWEEEHDYREFVSVIEVETGAELETFPGYLREGMFDT